MKITVITSSRADWNSTGMVIRSLRAAAAFDVSIIVLAASGSAFDAVKAAMSEDGAITGTITWFSLNVTEDDPVNLANAAGEACRLTSEALYALKPDLVVLPGDRWEVASSAIAVAMAGIPIAHLGGGDRTYGSMDDRWRNVITQLATIHFATNVDASERLAQNRLGSESARLLVRSGSPSVDRLMATELMTAGQCVSAFGHVCESPFVLVNWQPETASTEPNKGLHDLVDALRACGAPRVFFVGQNPDVGSMDATHEIEISLCARPERIWRFFPSLVPKVYLSLLKHCICLVGNSSSGIYEAPYLGTPVINVGQRQTGRVRLPFVFQADNAADIESMLRSMIELGRPNMSQMPDYYGDGHACERIVQTLREFKREKKL